MGNVEVSLFKEYESQSGNLLISAIKSSNKKKLEDAIEVARKQLITPNMKKSHEEDYKEMTNKILVYLTQKYDVGDGVLYRKTPLELAKSIGSDEITMYLEENIKKLEAAVKATEVANTEKYEGISKNVGKIDKDRVSLAKSRLENFRNNPKT
jgi:hypothetical protein